MQKRRIGTFSMAIVLIAFGIILFVAQINQLSAINISIKFWPIILLLLGGEILWYSYRHKEDMIIKYDIFSMFIIVLIIIVSLGVYGLSEIDAISKEGSKIFIDPSKTNRWVYNGITKDCKVIEGMNITTKLKGIKNEVEIKNLNNAYIKDGVALVKFLYWMDQNIKKIKMTEISVSDKLEEFRKEQKDFMGPSFDTICAYKDHAPMMHYKATEESEYELEKEGMLLIDSGGQYLDGTTDITRTIVLGDITEEEKRDFTLTLKGHINLMKARFLYGATGSNLDILARIPLWQEGLDYKCGTGHGVGFFLNVHEGPHRFSPVPNKVKLEKGMVITIEPGVYKEGKHGIRIENDVVVARDIKTDSGQFMKFDLLSYCPIDLDGVDVNILDDSERKWLNDYHEAVYNKLSPYLDENEKDWLKGETRRI